MKKYSNTNESLYYYKYIDDIRYCWIVYKLWKDNSFYYPVNRFDTEQEAIDHIEMRLKENECL